MHPSLSPIVLLAELRPPMLFVLVLAFAGFGFALILSLISQHYRDREAIRQHETARIALERGQPIPKFPDTWGARGRAAQFEDPSKRWTGLLIGGLVNVAVGIGVFIMLGSILGPNPARWAGLIPGLVGVALLLSALIVGLTSRNRDKGAPPPMS